MSAKKTKNAARGGFTPASTAWKARSARAKSVGEFLPTLMQPAFEKFGFPAAALLTDWEAIAGADLAGFTAPERLKWPRKQPDEDNRVHSRQSGATLILRVSGARALEVDYLRGQLIERINAAFGYRAVAEIRILQAPLQKRETTQRKCPPPAKTIPALSGIEEERLKAALARIGSAIAANTAQKSSHAQL